MRFWLDKAAQLALVGNVALAEQYCRKFVAQVPNDYEGLKLLCLILRRRDNNSELVATSAAALKIHPNAAFFFVHHGMAQLAVGYPRDAIESLERAVQLTPDDDDAHRWLGSAYHANARLDDALNHINQAIAIESQSAEYYVIRGQILADLGHGDNASQNLRKALVLRGPNVADYYRFAMVCPSGLLSVDVDILEELVAAEDLPFKDQVQARFALGAANEQVGRFDEAFAYYDQARHMLMAQSGGVKSEISRLDPDAVVLAYEKQAANTIGPVGELDPSLIVVVGPSRSGKSTVEQIVCGFGGVVLAAEDPVLHRAFNGVVPENVTPQDIARLFERLQKELAILAPLGQTVVLTHPENHWFLGVLALMSGSVKVIVCRRNLADLLAEQYFYFYEEGERRALTQDGVAEGLIAFDRLMASWHDTLNLPMQVVNYEDLIRDPQIEIDNISAFCGHRTGPVAAGKYTGRATGRWVSFANHLAPGLAVLGQPQSATGAQPTPPDARRFAALNSFFEARQAFDVGDLTRGERALAEALANNPNNASFHLLHGRMLESAKQTTLARQSFWRACQMRPLSAVTRQAYDCLVDTLSADASTRSLAKLHADIYGIAERYRAVQDLVFGDYDIYYQSFDELMIPGMRDTRQRFATYGLGQLISPGDLVLDVGCNSGFLALACAKQAARVDGFDYAPGLIEIGQRVVAHLGVTNCNLFASTFDDFKPKDSYDVIVAGAVHQWFKVGPREFGKIIRGMLNDGGHLLIESQGRRSAISVEQGFDAYVDAVISAGFVHHSAGQLCDDDVNLRQFYVLTATTPPQ